MQHTPTLYAIKLFDTYAQTLNAEKHAVSFLEALRIFESSAALCLGTNGGLCANTMSQIEQKIRKGAITLSRRCSLNRDGNIGQLESLTSFLTYRDAKNRARCSLSLKEILLIVCHFVYSQDTIKQLMVKTVDSKHTVVD